jgi:hypothetical protein
MALVAACGPSSGAGLDALPARTAVVGQELSVRLHAQGSATMSYSSDLDDLATRMQRPTLTEFDGGLAVFRWIPLGSDAGDHYIDFAATTGGIASSVRLDVSVLAGPAGLTYREPAGEGTSLDPAHAPCAEVSILVDDTSASAVELTRGEVWSDPGELNQDGPLSGTLKFCPTQDQLAAGSLWQFSIVADDHAGGRVAKRYTVVLSSLPSRPTPTPAPDPTPMCGAIAPTLIHTQHKNITTAGNLHLYAEVTDPDPEGVYDATVYWALGGEPADPTNPDLTLMEYLPMTFTGGTVQDSNFAATLSNPNLGEPAAATTPPPLRCTRSG